MAENLPCITIIAAMSKNFVIGRNNDLIWKISEDLQRFKRITTGKPVIMGRKTWESLGKALPNRKNIVITRQPDYVADGADTYVSLQEAVDACDSKQEIMIIGGGEIYAQALPMAHKLEVTRILAEAEGDTFFPEFSEKDWILLESEHHSATEECPAYCFETWQRR